MKKLLAILALTTVFVSCDKDSQNLINSTLKRVTISPAISPRATELSFEQGDKIGLTIIKEGQSTHADNAPMTFTNGVFAGDVIWYESPTVTSDIIAYYPYSSAGMPSTFTVVTDQTTGYGASDFMGAVKPGVTPTNNVVGMIFKHLLSKIVVNVNQTDTEITSVVLQNSIPAATIDLVNLTAMANQTVPVADITAQTVTAHANYRAIVVPQTASLTVVVTTPGKTYTRKLSSATLIGGGQYSINMEIANGQFKVSMSGDIENWTDGGEIGPEPVLDFTNGAFILNEGNMSTEPGSLLYIGRDRVIHDNVYEEINGSKLGNTCQDMYIRNGKIYFVSQNGGFDGKLVIADATTLVKEKGIATIPNITFPTHLAVTSNNTIYVRGGNGVFRYNPITNVVTKLMDTGAKNRMIAKGDKVYVYSGSSIYVLQDGNDEVVEKVNLAKNILGIVPSSDGNIWAASSAAIYKLDPETYTYVTQSTTTSMSEIMSAPSISAFENRIYFRKGTNVWCHDFTSGTTEQVGEVLSSLNYDEKAGTFYNGFGVHPTTEEVYYTSIKGYGLDYLTNYIGIFDFNNPSTPLKAKFNDYLRFPAGIYYPETFE